MEKDPQPKLDWDFFEYVIAYNSTFEETYTAAVADPLKLKFISNANVRAYLGILYDFYKTRSTLPTPTEIKAYLTTAELKTQYRDVVSRFATMDSVFNQSELIANTERYIRERAVFYAVKETATEVTTTEGVDSGSILNRFEDACGISLVDNLGFDYFNQIDEHCVNLTTKENYIPTGYTWLDKMLGGGFLEAGRALYMFTGATNSGKSILLGNLAANVAGQGKTIVVITLEMPETVYSKRISSKLTGIPLGELKRETELLKQQIEAYKAKNPNARIIMKEFPPNSINANTIKAYLKKLVQQKKLKIDAVFLDYLTLMMATNPTGNTYVDGKTIAEQVRALSYPLHFGCPFISACQANRSAYDEANPGIQTTGESIGIPQTADFQASIWSSDEDKELGIIHVGVQKSRFGANYGKYTFRIDYDTLSMTEQDDVFGKTDELSKIGESLERLGS